MDMTNDSPDDQPEEKVIEFPGSETPAEEVVEPVQGVSRQLNGDERVSFTVLGLYLAIFCVSSFLFWNSLALRILGGTAAVLGAVLICVAILNPGKAPRRHSKYTRRWYLMAMLCSLLAVFALRLIATRLTNHVISISIIYGTLTLLFVVFRKAMIQTLMLVVAVVFMGVVAGNWRAASSGKMGFMDTLRQSGQVVFRARHIREVANTLVAGNYMNYLNKVDYRDPQINQVAVRQVLDANDDDLLKTKAILAFVSDQISYVSDPSDGGEYAKDPINTLIAGGGDCEDQTVLLCSMLESVGVKTYMAFTKDHVFAYVRLGRDYPELDALPRGYINGRPCYMLDAVDPGAVLGYGAEPVGRTERVFDVRSKELVEFEVRSEG